MAGTNPLPPVDWYAPPVPPQGYGLYSAATNFDVVGPARQLGGVRVHPYNCDTGYGTYGTDLCDDDPVTKAAGERGPYADFTALVVYGAAECATDQTEAEELARAQHNRELHEPLLVESAFATKILSDAGLPATAATLGEAIGAIEAFMGEYGYTGVIHASRKFAAPASQYRWGNQSGSPLRSPLGHAWAFGGGYESVLDNTLVVTGPVYTWRTAPFDQVVTTGSSRVAALNNSVYALSERIVVAAYECTAWAVTITG